MDVNELKIGDWVSYCKANNYVTKIIDIRAYSDEYAITCRRDKNDPLCEKVKGDEPFNTKILHPIELTTEILLNNGFHKLNDGSGDFIGFGYTMFSKEDGWYECTFIGKKGKLFTKIRYVHELQNALNICGIEKEILL